MQYEKVFEGTVDVPNPINFCADRKRHLLTELRNKYEGRCFKGAYVRTVRDVLAAGACHIMRTNGSGEGYVDVRFLADVEVFGRWDILVGVTLRSRAQLLIGTYGEPAPRAVVTLIASDSKSVESLAVGQLIPVRIVLAQHTPLQAHASIVGSLLTCDRAAPAFLLRGALGAAPELGPLLAAIEREMEAREALVGASPAQKAALWFFERLLHPYRADEAPAPDPLAAAGGAELAVEAWDGGPTWRGPEGPSRLEDGASARSVLAIARRAAAGESVPVAGVWSRSLALARSSPLAAVVPAEGASAVGWAPVEGEPRLVFAEFLKNILDFLVASRELVGVYGARDVFAAHSNLWSVMRAAQRPAA
jgi:hypothetical protein